MGDAYGSVPPEQRPGFIAGPVHIGAYSFIGPHCVIEAGTRIGKGCLVEAHSRVRGEFPDFAVIAGNPAQITGDTRTADAALLDAHPQWRAHYEAWAGAEATARQA
jgi:acetyltransferase-like isoleucine patch superfamily enzyme